MSPNLSVAEENYIKNIYHLQQQAGSVSTNALAAMLHAKPASVTDMLKKLKAKKLVQYEPYREFQLSQMGKRTALEIVRKHRLWEYFLVEKLKFGWHEVHEVAEELEHISSKKLVEQLDAFLDYPRFDPHGDPIPDSAGKMSALQQVSLVSLPLKTPAKVTAVGSQSPELLEMLKHKQIAIGTRLEISRRFAFDQSLELVINEGPPVQVSEQMARVLFVQPM